MTDSHDVQADLERLQLAASRGPPEFYALVRHLATEAKPAAGRSFGRTLAREGWTLDTARHLGILDGHDPRDVEAGYLDECRQTRLRL